jgi:hypothetical protein
MKKGRLLTIGGFAATMLALGTIIPTFAASGSGTTSTTYPNGTSYSPLPETMTTAFGVTLSELSESQLSSVNVTSAQAISVAESHEFSAMPSAVVPGIVLGNFSDSEYGTPQPEGAASLIAQNMPAYVVSFGNVSLPSYGPVGDSVVGQYDVVVNAITGDYVIAFSGP